MIDLSDRKPILIAGPTASGKSSIAIEIAKKTDGVIINADALQVYSGWNVITARPPAEDLDICQHYMYGHVGMDVPYSVGAWLRDIEQHLKICAKHDQRPIIVGGTGLYFTALTEGLAEIPEIPKEVRDQAEALLQDQGRDVFAKLLKDMDPNTYANIDVLNPVRTQRAWEVFTATGKGLFEWQQSQKSPLIAAKDADLISLISDTDWLNERINRRFEIMLNEGALNECSVAMGDWWDESKPSCKAIGAKELISHLQGQMDLTDAVEAAKLQSRRYAKRQRTWFRSRMKKWHKLHISDTGFDIKTLF